MFYNILTCKHCQRAFRSKRAYLRTSPTIIQDLYTEMSNFHIKNSLKVTCKINELEQSDLLPKHSLHEVYANPRTDYSMKAESPIHHSLICDWLLMSFIPLPYFVFFLFVFFWGSGCSIWMLSYPLMLASLVSNPKQWYIQSPTQSSHALNSIIQLNIKILL